MDYLHQFLFGIYPYIAAVIFLFGSLVRFEREQYSWKSESSQVLHAGSLRLGNILFHIGILGLFFGHLVGLLMPVAVWDALGISHSTVRRHMAEGFRRIALALARQDAGITAPVRNAAPAMAGRLSAG